MGFDIECVVDIHACPGEYFCPVCRTLVNPNEAFQSQCTHLYCKPCLAHIANGSRACPYDGYLVTESDSKPLMESDKARAEKIGQVKVRCLYFRSGCTWEGCLSDCISHCSECSFGNSAVICNRCGIQIAHRQVHEHAPSCPGVFGGQQAVTKSGTTSSTATAVVNNQTVAQSGAAPPQVNNPQNVSATPFAGKNPTVQANPISQAPVVAPVAGPTPEQWYQQQYQQYYQQYPGYDPYQQAGQQYYPPVQQYQQYPLPAQGQNQPYLLPNTLQNPQQANVQSQPQPQPQLQPKMQVPPRGHAPKQVNQQQQPHPSMRPPQTLPPPPPRSQPMQPPPSSQAVGMRPPAQHPQVPQYQQPQMPHPQATQAHVQTQMHLHPQQQTHTQSPAFPHPGNQSTAPASMPQAIAAMQPPTPPVSGHHSYQQPQPAHPHPATGSLHQAPVYDQVPQQPAMMRPPNSHGSLPQQQPPGVLPPQNQVPGIYPAQQFPPQPSQPIQHHPVMLPVQQGVAQQYAQQPPLYQLHQQNNYPQQQPTQPQLRPPYPPQTQQSQNYVGMPMMPNQGINLQSHPLSSSGFGPVAHSGPVVNQKNANSNVLEENEAAQKTISPSKGLIEKDSKGKSIKEEVISEKRGSPQGQGHHGHKDDKLNAFSREHLNVFPEEPMRSLGQSSRSFEKAPQRPTHEAELKFDADALRPNSRFLPHHHPSGGHGHGHGQADTFGPGPEFDQDHKQKFASRSSDREYLGSSTQEIGGPSGFPRGISGFNDVNAREAHRFDEGTRSFNVSSDPVGNPFRDGRFLSLPDHPPRGEFDAPGVRKRRRDDDVFGQDESDHLKRGKFPGPRNVPSHFSMGESSGPGGFHDRALVLGGPGNFPRPPFNGPVGGPPMRGSYRPPFAGGMESLDQMWKRNPVSMGWCRICRIDCETVEGLDMHSQTREHQNMAKDIVKAMKLQNKKKQRNSAGRMGQESSSRGRKAGFVGRGS